MSEQGKLVRDLLAEPIKVTDPQAQFEYLQGARLERALQAKLQEETGEFLAAGSKADQAEEAGDIVEVLECLLELSGITLEEMLTVKAEKAQQRGSFKNGLFWQKDK